MEKILITSALPYANAPLHFGHIAGAYLPGDCYARFQRLKKRDVRYFCGSDEYGVAITMSAELAGRTPKEHVDIYHKINKELFEKLHFSFDHYSRTTWEGHKAPVQKYFLDLLENGFIEERVTEQLYSEIDQKFLADRYVVGECPRCGFDKARGDECPSCGESFEATDLKNPRSKMTGSPLSLKPTKHWFLKLDLFKERLLEWLETKEWKPNVMKFAKNFIEDLRPRAITRDSDWGIPVPLEGASHKVLYVWFDAPIGYLSSAMEWSELIGDKEAWKRYWQDPKTKLVQFIGKDNIPFHASIFPAMTMGQNLDLKLVDELPANEFYNLEGRKFSKSEGWTIDFEEFFKKYTADQIRYAIGANAPESSDAEFTWQDFQVRCNAELLGKLGNFVNRVVVFAKNKCGGEVIPPIDFSLEDRAFLETQKALLNEIEEAFETFKLRRACQLLMELCQVGNGYFEKQAPWKDAKLVETEDRMRRTIFCCLEAIKCIALASYPIIPETAEAIWKMLGEKSSLLEQGFDRIRETPLSRRVLGEPKILFRKIEDAEIEEELLKLQGNKNLSTF
jgi:methionyl-tRNA synthetase